MKCSKCGVARRKGKGKCAPVVIQRNGQCVRCNRGFSPREAYLAVKAYREGLAQ